MPDTLKFKPIVPEMYQNNIHKNNDLDENVALKSRQVSSVGASDTPKKRHSTTQIEANSRHF
ncbi:Uncharacterised protein [Anaerobiospirillum thomasii]|nr:Uncharacterised protein [Anaerobiospirillum thomasii]